MASNWILFESNMKSKISFPNQLSISELSDIHATEYVNAVNTATIIFTKSPVSIGINKEILKLSFESMFNALFKETIEILPNYKNDNPTDNEIKDRDKLEHFFLPVAITIVREWTNELFTQTTVPVGYVSPTTGYRVLVPGDPINLAKDLSKAFYISQNELNQNVAFKLFISNLILAYTEHMLKISGIFNGLIPGSPSPVPGPVFPWIGVI